jgi:nucleoside-diphosphate-sugar epimerase
MKVLVCGARGFIGRHVAAALQTAGHSVLRGVSRAPARASASSTSCATAIRPPGGSA